MEDKSQFQTKLFLNLPFPYPNSTEDTNLVVGCSMPRNYIICSIYCTSMLFWAWVRLQPKLQAHLSTSKCISICRGILLLYNYLQIKTNLWARVLSLTRPAIQTFAGMFGKIVETARTWFENLSESMVQATTHLILILHPPKYIETIVNPLTCWTQLPPP